MVTESDVSNHIFIYLSQRLARRQFPDGEARSDSFREEKIGAISAARAAVSCPPARTQPRDSRGAAILRSPVNIDAVRSIFGQGHVASVLSKIYMQMMIALCRSVPLFSGFRMPAILHACA